MDIEYTLFLEEHEYALAREKQEVASIAKQKANMIANEKGSNPVLWKFHASTNN